MNEIGKTKQEMLDDLRVNVVSFRFMKKNGELRDMIGTLNFDKIAEEFRPVENDTVLAESVNSDLDRDLVKIFDMEMTEWRSFLPSSVQTWDVI